MSARSLLLRGMGVGLVAGLLAYLFGTLVGEPPVDAAIAFEAAHAPAGPAEPQLVSRTVQSTLGLGTAMLFYGAALGGVLALVTGAALGRTGRLRVRGTALVVAAVGFVAVALVPFLTYPADPPAVGAHETIQRRTALYGAMLLVSLLAVGAGAATTRSLLPRVGGWNAVLAGLGLFVVIVTATALTLPTVDEVPADFPAGALWQFRVASLGSQVVLWTSFGLLFGALTERRASRAVSRAALVTAHASP